MCRACSARRPISVEAPTNPVWGRGPFWNPCTWALSNLATPLVTTEQKCSFLRLYFFLEPRIFVHCSCRTIASLPCIFFHLCVTGSPEEVDWGSVVSTEAWSGSSRWPGATWCECWRFFHPWILPCTVVGHSEWQWQCLASLWIGGVQDSQDGSIPQNGFDDLTDINYLTKL